MKRNQSSTSRSALQIPPEHQEKDVVVRQACTAKVAPTVTATVTVAAAKMRTDVLMLIQINGKGKGKGKGKEVIGTMMVFVVTLQTEKVALLQGRLATKSLALATKSLPAKMSSRQLHCSPVHTSLLAFIYTCSIRLETRKRRTSGLNLMSIQITKKCLMLMETLWQI